MPAAQKLASASLPTLQWYAVRTSTRQELRAHRDLTEAGFSVFMPCETLLRRLCREYEVITRPLFPGYLFVLCREADYDGIKAMDTIHAFVCSASRDDVPHPLPVPLVAILQLQAEERQGLYDRTRNKRPPYRPRKGDKVKITAGPWQAFMARVLDTPRGDRAQVMIQGPFGRGMTVDVEHLSAA